MLFRDRQIAVFLAVAAAALLFISATIAFGSPTRGKTDEDLTQPVIPTDEQNHDGQVTTWGSLHTTGRRITNPLKSTWGVSSLRDFTDTGNAASITSDSGIIILESGTNTSGTAAIESRERSEYQPGAPMESGLAIRLSDTPTGSQEARWGHFDKDNGFGWGVDDTGFFVFTRRSGSDTIIRQSSWNRNKLNGTTPDVPNLSVTEGRIYQVRFNWYGYGDIHYWANVLQTTNGNTYRENVLAHTRTNRDQTSVIDPNQPLRVEVRNGGNTSDNLKVEIGGRQQTIISSAVDRVRRPVNEFVSDHQLDGTENVWEPLIACRKKEPFPAGSDRDNSVLIQVVQFQGDVESNDVQFKLTISDTTSGATFADPTDWGTESAVECENTADGFTADQGLPILRRFVPAGGNDAATIAGQDRIVLGKNKLMILWARKESTNNATVSATLKWDEQW